MEFTEVLRSHRDRYPQMMPADVVKLVYQSEFGGEYATMPGRTAFAKLKKEMEAVAADESAALTEPIGGGFMRVNLAAMPTNNISVFTLDSLYVMSSEMYGGTVASFCEKLECVYGLQKEEGLFAFSLEELEDFLRAYFSEGRPYIPHSEVYKEQYRPAYRVVHKELLDLYLFKV